MKTRKVDLYDSEKDSTVMRRKCKMGNDQIIANYQKVAGTANRLIDRLKSC